jgi:hypothetical protein
VLFSVFSVALIRQVVQNASSHDGCCKQFGPENPLMHLVRGLANALLLEATAGFLVFFCWTLIKTSS